MFSQVSDVAHGPFVWIVTSLDHTLPTVFICGLYIGKYLLDEMFLKN